MPRHVRFVHPLLAREDEALGFQLHLERKSKCAFLFLFLAFFLPTLQLVLGRVRKEEKTVVFMCQNIRHKALVDVGMEVLQDARFATILPASRSAAAL